MNVAIIRGSRVENIILCDDIAFAEKVFPDALCLDADAEELRIGDQYPKPIEPIPEPVNPDADRDAMLIDHELRLTMMELGVI